MYTKLKMIAAMIIVGGLMAACDTAGDAALVAQWKADCEAREGGGKYEWKEMASDYFPRCYGK